MSDATATILQSYGKPYEFGLLDRKVVVCTENDVDEQNDPSLYSLVRAWVRNGYIPARKADTEASPPFSLPPSQPAPQEKLEYPEECFTKSYVQDETDVSNLASVYKTAWMTTHSTYTAFKAKRRRRHETRHSALLAVAQQNQKARLNKPPKPPPSAEPASAEAAPPAPPTTTRAVPLAPAPLHAKGHRPAAEDLLRSHNLTMRSGSTPLANTPQPLEKRGNANASRQSPSSFGVGYMVGADTVRQAHNLADRGNAIPATSASPAAVSGDPNRMARVPGPVNLADMHHLRGTHSAGSGDGVGGGAAAMQRGSSPSALGMGHSVPPPPESQRLPQPTKAQLQAHIHAQAQAQVRAQLEAAQAAAAAAEAAQGDAGAGAAAAARGPLSAAKLAGPVAPAPGVAPQPGPGPAPLRDRREQGWRGRDLGRQFGAMSGRAPVPRATSDSFGGGNGEEK